MSEDRRTALGEDCPDLYKCPITHDLMYDSSDSLTTTRLDPVLVVESGQTYDKIATTRVWATATGGENNTMSL